MQGGWILNIGVGVKDDVVRRRLIDPGSGQSLMREKKTDG